MIFRVVISALVPSVVWCSWLDKRNTIWPVKTYSCNFERFLWSNSISIQCTSCQKWVHKKCSGIQASMYKVMKSFICRGCSNPVISRGRSSVDIGASANLELVDKFCYLGDTLSVEGDADAAVEAGIRIGWNKFRQLVPLLTTTLLLLQPFYGPFSGTTRVSWCHCLPIGIYHWLGEGGCIAVVCKVLCDTEVRPGLSGKTRTHQEMR